MLVAIDGRPLQKGFREHAGRGIGRYACELVRALGRRPDLELELWFEPGLDLPHHLIPDRASVRQYGRLNLPMRDRLTSNWTVPQGIRASRAEVFHVLAHGDAPARVPRNVVVTVHDLILEVFEDLYPGARSFKYRLARMLEASTLQSTRTILADSHSTRDDLVRLHRVAPARVHVAHLGVDAAFRPASADDVASLRARFGLVDPFVLYVGGMDARKNVTLLVEAFAHARNAGLPGHVELVFAGRIDDALQFQTLRQRAEALGFGDVFRSIGFVSDQDLPTLLSAADVFAFPSLYEGFGLPPLEAMACGAPVVSSPGGSLAEVVGDAALLAPSDAASTFGAAIARVLMEPALSVDLKQRGLARAATFTWDRCAEATVSAYRAAAVLASKP